jgi:hypothetical protein
MNLHEHTNELLQRVAEDILPDALSGDPLKLTDENQCILTLDEKIIVMIYLDETTSTLILTVPITKLPDDVSRGAVMLELLRANYCWNLTQGGTLGVDRTTDLICLNYLVDLPLAEPAQMPQIISKLAAVSPHWMNVIAEMSSDTEDAIPADAGSMIRA